MIRKRPTVSNPQTCPGINNFIRPTVSYVKCHICGGDVEVWSDEDKGICMDCGADWVKPDETTSCLEYCEYADQCRNIINESRFNGG